MKESDKLKTRFFRLMISMLMTAIMTWTIVSVEATRRPEAVLDQEVGEGLSGGAHSIVFYSPCGQTFKPSLNRLAYIQVAIGSGGGPPAKSAKAVYTFKLKVTDATGQLVAFRILSFHGALEYQPEPFPWITFDFHDVPVIPGNKYIMWLEIVHLTGGWPMWEERGYADAYPDGVPIINGVENPHPGAWDFLFKTYGYSVQ